MRHFWVAVVLSNVVHCAYCKAQIQSAHCNMVSDNLYDALYTMTVFSKKDKVLIKMSCEQKGYNSQQLMTEFLKMVVDDG